MQEQTEGRSLLSPELQKIHNKGLYRTAFISQVNIAYLDELFTDEKNPKGLRQNAQIAIEALTRVKNNIETSVSAKGNKYLSKELGKDKLFDMTTIIENMARVGAEENQEVYEEFMGLIVDLVDKVFYAQENRKNIHFSKYKALFQLIRDELKADTDKVPGQVWYRGGELWLRTAQPDKNVELKDEL